MKKKMPYDPDAFSRSGAQNPSSRRCRPGGDGMVKVAFATLLLHFGAQVLHRARVAWMATAACSHAASHFGAQILHRAGVAWMATAAFATLLLHFGAQILHRAGVAWMVTAAFATLPVGSGV